MGNSRVVREVALFSVAGRIFVRTIEEAIRAAKRKARGGNSVEIAEISSGEIVARAWPDGKVDATFAGSRFVTTWETTK